MSYQEKLKDACLKYLQVGWSFFPFGIDRIPLVDWKKYQYVQPTVEEIEGWFNRKVHQIGIVAGKTSGLIIVDDDTRKNGIPPLDLEGTTPLVAKSKSGGRHYYYGYTDGILSCKNHNIHVEIMSDGGNCTLPPSELGGGSYEWISKPKSISELKNLPEIPSDLLSKVYAGRDAKDNTFDVSALSELMEGSRNDILFRFACSLQARAFDNKDVATLVFSVNRGLDNPLEEDEVGRILKSVFNYKKGTGDRHYKDSYKKEDKKTTREIKSLTLKEVVELRKGERDIEKKAVTTGYSGLDDLFKGFIPHQFIALVGDTNVGKTSLACNFAIRLSLIDKKTLYVAFETGNRVIETLASIRTCKRYEDISCEDFEKVGENIEYVTSTHTVDEFVSFMKDNTHKYDLVVIDHLSYFVSGGDETAKQSDLAKILCDLSKESGTPILGIIHIKKDDKRKKIAMTDAKGSSSWYQDSQVFLYVVRDKLAKEGEDALKDSDYGYVAVMKQKSGRNGVMHTRYYPETGVITGREGDTPLQKELHMIRVNYQKKKESLNSIYDKNVLSPSEEKIRMNLLSEVEYLEIKMAEIEDYQNLVRYGLVGAGSEIE